MIIFLPIRNEKGAIPLLLIIAVIGVLGIIAIANLAPFKNSFLGSLYPKERSFASTSDPISGPVSPSPLSTASGTITVKPNPCLYTGPGSCDVSISFTASDPTTATVKIKETGQSVTGFKRNSSGSFSVKYPMSAPAGSVTKTTFDLSVSGQIVNSAVETIETPLFNKTDFSYNQQVYPQEVENLTAELTTNRDITVDIVGQIKNLAGKSIVTKILKSQQFSANQLRSILIQMTVPAGTAAGDYVIDFSVRNPANGLYYIANQTFPIKILQR